MYIPSCSPSCFRILVRSSSCWADRSGNVCRGGGEGGGETKLKMRLARLDCLIEQLAIVSIIWLGPGGICHCGVHTVCHTQARSNTHTDTHALPAVHMCAKLCVFVWVFQSKCIPPNVFSSFQIQCERPPVCVCVCVFLCVPAFSLWLCQNS